MCVSRQATVVTTRQTPHVLLGHVFTIAYGLGNNALRTTLGWSTAPRPAGSGRARFRAHVTLRVVTRHA